MNNTQFGTGFRSWKYNSDNSLFQNSLRHQYTLTLRQYPFNKRLKCVCLEETFITVIELWHKLLPKRLQFESHARKSSQIWKLLPELFSDVVKTNELIHNLFDGMPFTILLLKRLRERTNPYNKKLIFNKDEACLNFQMQKTVAYYY